MEWRAPNEKTESMKAPLTAVDDVEANIKIDPKIGPTQGVQPRLKDEPNTKELKGLPGLMGRGSLNFISRDKNGILKTFNIYNPKIITKTPAI